MHNNSLPENCRKMVDRAFAESKSEKTLRQLWIGINNNPNWQNDEADIFLCLTLATCFNGDPALVDAAYRQSGLFNEKWDGPYYNENVTYGAKIVEMVTAGFREYNDDNPRSFEEIDDSSFGDWPDPFPLDDYSQLPKYPINALLGPCGKMACATSKHCQVDSGLTATMVLASLSAALGGKVQVNLGTHKEPVNLYAIGIVGSGNRKSETVSQSVESIYIHQRYCQEELKPIIKAAENKRSILEKRLDQLQKEAAKKNDVSERQAIIKQCNDVITEIDANPVPKKPVFIVDDITTEALGQLMADNGERMAILSAEGGLFKIISGLYNNGQSNLDLFLKAHAGDYWSNNRIGRESKMMIRPALTLGLAVQPDVIDEIGKNQEFRGRGLSARFLYSYCRSRAGYRTRQSEPMPPDIKFAYNKKITALMSLEKNYELTLTPKAQSLWDSFYDTVEKLLRPGAELANLVDWGSKLPGEVARIAGLLHFADSADEFPRREIEWETVFCACDIGWYYLEHAKYVFGLMKEDSTVTSAKKILKYLKHHKPVEFKARDLFNHTNIQSMQDIKPGLDVLLKNFYIREVEQCGSEIQKGRPAAISYTVNPRIF